ncbi:hypothetical protein ACFXJ8_02520 [Nonomuraea sp. NPDC059194]|uniref:hypothetical protein n=1 Tax=Nonomuraea sp. NPDC059194 TaxID=3346764 RepID=UPI00368D1367
MSVMVMLVAVLVLAGLSAWAWLLGARCRRFFGEHRVLTAVTILPLQPLLLIGVVALAISAWEQLELSGVVICLIAYVNGLIAFAVVALAKDLRAVRRR